MSNGDLKINEFSFQQIWKIRLDEVLEGVDHDLLDETRKTMDLVIMVYLILTSLIWILISCRSQPTIYFACCIKFCGKRIIASNSVLWNELPVEWRATKTIQFYGTRKIPLWWISPIKFPPPPLSCPAVNYHLAKFPPGKLPSGQFPSGQIPPCQIAHRWISQFHVSTWIRNVNNLLHLRFNQIWSWLVLQLLKNNEVSRTNK